MTYRRDVRKDLNNFTAFFTEAEKNVGQPDVP